MSDVIKERLKLYEIKTIQHEILCKCGTGNMVGNGAVRLAGNAYEHEHHCVFFDAGFDKRGCGATEWFPLRYPLREEHKVLIADTGA
jgi:hypothetical protein